MSGADLLWNSNSVKRFSFAWRCDRFPAPVSSTPERVTKLKTIYCLFSESSQPDLTKLKTVYFRKALNQICPKAPFSALLATLPLLWKNRALKNDPTPVRNHQALFTVLPMNSNSRRASRVGGVTVLVFYVVERGLEPLLRQVGDDDDDDGDYNDYDGGDDDEDDDDDGGDDGDDDYDVGDDAEDEDDDDVYNGDGNYDERGGGVLNKYTSTLNNKKKSVMLS